MIPFQRSSSFAGVVVASILTLNAPAGADLTLDPTFGDEGQTIANYGPESDGARDVALAADGSLVLAGYVRTAGVDRFAAIRLDENGEFDETFGEAGWATAVPMMGNNPRGEADARAVAIQPDDGKIVMAGVWHDQSDVRRLLLVRLLPGGALDSQFGEGGLAVIDLPLVNATDSLADAVEVLAGGRILVAGSFDTALTGARAGFVIALEEDGDLDPTFGSGGLYWLYSDDGSSRTGFVDLCVLDDGKILATGGMEVAVTVRLLEDGTPDPDFADLGVMSLIGQEDSFIGSACGVQDSGRALVGVVRESTRDEDLAQVLGLSADGQIDEDFADDGFAPFREAAGVKVSAMAVRESGDIVVAGSAIPLAHLSRNGSLLSLADDPMLAAQARKLVVDGDGRVVAVGQVSSGETGGAFSALRLDVPSLECAACGEVTGDCKITAADALLTLKMAVGQLSPDLVADMDGNQKLTAGDALAILRVSVGLVEPFQPCPAP